MRSMFKSHSPKKKHSRSSEYLKGGDFHGDTGRGPDGRQHLFSEVCARCGRSFGSHSSRDRCPKEE